MNKVQADVLATSGISEDTVSKFQSKYSNAVAFVTGGASGLGFAQAQLLKALGCRVAIADIRQDALDNAREKLADGDEGVLAVQLDIRSRDEFVEAAKLVIDHFGEPPSLLFNTAGVNGFGKLSEASYQDFDWVMGVNLNGVINGIQTFLPKMIRKGSPAHIVSTGSMAGFAGSPSAAIYAATKAAVFNLMESYHLDLRPKGIGVSVLCPASIRTNIAETLDARPPELAAQSSFRNDEDFRQIQRDLYATGMDPLSLASRVVLGIVRDELYVLPFGETKDGLQTHFETILNAFDEPDEAAHRRAADFEEYRRRANSSSV